MNLTKEEQSALRVIQQTPQWNTVVRLANQLISLIENSPVPKTSEWEMVKATLEKEGRIKGIKEFFKEVLNQSQIQ